MAYGILVMAYELRQHSKLLDVLAQRSVSLSRHWCCRRDLHVADNRRRAAHAYAHVRANASVPVVVLGSLGTCSFSCVSACMLDTFLFLCQPHFGFLYAIKDFFGMCVRTCVEASLRSWARTLCCDILVMAYYLWHISYY